ncbi:MAG: glutamate synthase subunit beta [Erysipelotrichia bacterium]|nr:glutamate synthase subunit beta [Erysipelotrichia bacterium]NCC53859.1 glutamate synthase subunit beta [Erysipelotrichia bacterium]
MGKTGGFLTIKRMDSKAIAPTLRIQNFNEFHLPLSKKQQQEQGARCMDCGVPFCQNGQMIASMTSGCPLNNLIPEWNDLIYHDHYEQALYRLLKTSPFPEFTSRVCPALCEKACTCSLHGDAVSVKENELAIIEYGFANQLIKPHTSQIKTGKKVAIIGSGPSGLACAQQLSKRGHQVSVYERHDRVGGLLMYGIPNMKLEKHIIERRLQIMRKEGIEFKVNQNVTNKEQADTLLKDYDAIVLACGASKPRDINVAGRDGKGIYFAVDFLTSTTKALLDNQLTHGYINAKDKHVLVIGGGDTGNDCVATSIRHGCKSVLQLEMMPKPPICRSEDNPWPEWPKVLKTDYGQEESIAVFKKNPRIYQTTVKEFIKNAQGEVVKAKLVKLAFVTDEKTGKKQMQEVADSEWIVDCDLVLIAAGFIGAQEEIVNAFNVKVNARNNVEANELDYQCNVEKVFASGDVRRGQSLVVWAIKEGMECAKSVDKYLMGYSNL